VSALRKVNASLTFLAIIADHRRLMQPWVQAAFALGFLVLIAVLAMTLLSVRRAVVRAEAVLGIVEQELRPLVAETHAVLGELRALTRQANREMDRIGSIGERVEEVAAGVGRLVGALGGLTRVGQVLGLAAGLKKGIDVFLYRYGKGQGDHNG
jgi:hypothetical protein